MNPTNTTMPLIDSFLQQGVNHTRQSVLDIDDSYNNEWDILAELVQNSVDAIRETGRKTGTISIKVDCQNKVIGVKDDGIGINPEEVIPLLALFGTNKKNNEATIGEKGVGLKFVMFSCNYFYMKTATTHGGSEVLVENACNWKKSTDEKHLPLIKEDIPNDFEGTEIILEKVEDSPLFDLTIAQLKYVLRTRTAIGNTTKTLANDPFDVKVTLNYTSPDGNFKIVEIPFKYLLPIEEIVPDDKISLSEYYEYIQGGNRDDNQKRLKLKNKIVYDIKKIPVRNREIYAFTCMVPGRATWSALNNHFNLATDADLENEAFLQNFSYATIQPGIFVSVKGMPTGIRIEPPITGSAGTWGSIFMLFEDRKLTFDIGRKSIHGKTQKIYQEYARDIFNEYRNNVLKYVSGSISPETTQWDRDEIFREIEGIIDLNSDKTKFIKTPKNQEASVAGVFFECLGSGVIKDIKPLISGYKNKYDLYAWWGNKRVVIEFKAELHKILKDVKDQVKLFNEVDCIVCWDVSELDEQVFKNESIALEKVQKGTLLNKSNENFPHASHVLRYSNFAKPIYVIDLKILLGA